MRAPGADLAAKTKDFVATFGDLRRRLGNPYFYSGKGGARHVGETVAQYSGYKSHEPGLALVQEAQALQREIATIRDRLRELGAAVD